MKWPETQDGILGCKWSVAILAALGDGACRPSELLRLYPALTGKVLWERLRKLQRNGLVVRFAHDTFPRHSEYRLTEQGEALAVWAKALMGSGLTFDELTTVLKCRYMVAVLRLLAKSPRRPKELRARLKVADKLLFDRLAKLETLRLVQREIVPTRPIRVHYHLTERGKALLPLLIVREEMLSQQLASR